MTIKTYSELITIPTFLDRYEYLRLSGKIGEDTFGFDRYINQVFYSSSEWKRFRDSMIIRDAGCDLGVPGYEIGGVIILHHINPLQLEDITSRRIDRILNPENVICVSHNTHNAIHYGDNSLLIKEPIVRTKNDTCPWRQ